MATSRYISSSREEAASQIPPPKFGGHVLDMSNVWPRPPSHHHHPTTSSFAPLETKGIPLPREPWGWGFQSRVYSKHAFFSVSKYAVVTESQVDRWTALKAEQCPACHGSWGLWGTIRNLLSLLLILWLHSFSPHGGDCSSLPWEDNVNNTSSPTTTHSSFTRLSGQWLGNKFF